MKGSLGLEAGMWGRRQNRGREARPASWAFWEITAVGRGEGGTVT